MANLWLAYGMGGTNNQPRQVTELRKTMKPPAATAWYLRRRIQIVIEFTQLYAKFRGYFTMTANDMLWNVDMFRR